MQLCTRIQLQCRGVIEVSQDKMRPDAKELCMRLFVGGSSDDEYL